MKSGLVSIAVVVSFILCFHINSKAMNYVSNGDAENTASELIGNVNGLKLYELNSTNNSWDVYDYIPGWRSGVTDAGIEVQYDGNVVNAHSPFLYIELDSHTAQQNQDTNSSMIQDIVFDGTGSYELSFWYQPRTPLTNDNDIFVYFTFNDPDVVNPVLLGSVTGLAGPTTDWELHTFILNVNDISAPWTLMLSAGGIDNTTGGFIDDVSIFPLDSDNDGDPDNTDCNDTDPTIFTGAVEICGDGIDQDCDGFDLTCPDNDGDGVPNSADLCPNTPAGETVDANGCSQSQLDDDNDGVVNSIDLCPNTPTGETVDANGCALSQIDADGDGFTADVDCDDNNPAINPGATDTPCDGIDQNCDGVDATDATCTDDDNDGVPNSNDLCPNTPAGEPVDANGCSQSQLDDDNDGVPNSIDQCPNTPAGEPVNANGCSQGQLDDDNDGVPNNIDQCPNTPAGEAVDANGCSSSQIDNDGDGYTADVDCDDTNLDINPGMIEIAHNGVDDNCKTGFEFFFPKVDDSEGNPWYNNFSVQNLANTDQQYTITCYYGPDGIHQNGELAATQTRTVPALGTDKVRPAGAGTIWETNGESLGFTEFFGTCTIETPLPALVMNTFQNTRYPSGAYTVFEAAKPLSEMIFPKVFDNRWDWETWLSIMNPYSASKDVTVTLYDTAGNVAGQENVTIAPNVLYHKRAYQILDPNWVATRPDDNTFAGQNWVSGSYTVTASDPLPALVSYQHWDTNWIPLENREDLIPPPGITIADKISVYPSVETATNLYYPLNYETAGLPVDNAVGPFMSLSLTSPTIQTATANLFEYNGTPCPNNPIVDTFTQPNEIIAVRPAEYAGKAPTEFWEGALTVNTPSSIYGVSKIEHVGYIVENFLHLEDATSLAFLFPATPETKLYFPKAYDGQFGWAATLVIQNTTGTQHTVTVDFIRFDGVTITDDTIVVPGNGAVLINPGNFNGGLDGIPGYFNGSLTVTSTVPVAAVVQYSYMLDPIYQNWYGSLEVYNGLIEPTL